MSRARSLADVVVELDMGRPFTAARARNEGFDRLLKTRNDLQYVFFVDGDCEVQEGWVATAVKAPLTEHPDFAVVWGLRRERFPKNRFTTCCATWSGKIIRWVRRALAAEMLSRGWTPYCR